MGKVFVSTSELAKELEVPATTVKYYADQGFLIYYKPGSKTSKTEKMFPLNENRRILHQIMRMIDKGYTIAAIKEVWKFDPLRSPTKKDFNLFEKILMEGILKYLWSLDPEFMRCTACESYITTYWSGVEQPKEVMLDLHIKTNLGNVAFTEYFRKELQAGSAVWHVLWDIGNRLSLDALHPQLTHIWDKTVRDELDKEKRTVWELVNIKGK